MNAKIFAVLLISSVCLLGASEEASAIYLGKLTVNPYLNFSPRYEDNVFAQKTDTVADWYFITSPGIKMQLGQPERNMVAAEFWADVFRYVDTGAQNDVEDYNLKLDAAMNFPGGMSVRFADLGRRGHETRGQQNLAITGTGQQSRFWDNNAEIEVGYQLSDRFKAALAYKNYYIDYLLDSNDFRSRDENGASLLGYYQFMPKTSAFLQGIYNKVDHLQDTAAASRLDSDEYWAMAGLTWDITAKSKGTVKGGYEWKNFTGDSSGTNFSSPVYYVELDHSFTPKTSVRISGRRQANETDDPNAAYYTTTNGRIELTFRPVSKLSISPYGGYAYDRYSGETTVGGQTGRRTDNLWTAGGLVGYDFNKWVGISFGYEYTDRNSNLDFYDYKLNNYTVTIRLSV
jgi:predicted porin